MSGRLAACFVLCGCSASPELGPRDVELRAPAGDEGLESGDTDGGDVAPYPSTPWGQFVQSMDIPACPASAYEPLVVSSLGGELDGGSGITDPSQAGPSLSVVEALWVAVNRAGSETIRFDPAVFPLDAPATIYLPDVVLPMNMDAVCLDGRGRGVIIAWAPDASSSSIWDLRADGSLMVGLTLLETPSELSLGRGQIAGCRFNTDGWTTTPQGRPWTIEAAPGALVGPGNVFGDTATPIRWAALVGEVVVRGNYFGVDPAYRRFISPHSTLAGGDDLIDMLVHDGGADVRLVLAENVIAARGRIFDLAYASVVQTIEIRRNSIGAILGIGNLPPVVVGFDLDLPGRLVTVGPGNSIYGAAAAVVIRDGDVRITQNSISNNTLGIVHLDATPPPLPSISAASASTVAGQCPAGGVVEVFSDPGDQGIHYLASYACAGTESFELAVVASSGQNVTATFTDAGGHTSAFSAPVGVP